LCVDRLPPTRAALFPHLTVFWDTSHAVEKDRHLDDEAGNEALVAVSAS
jgi:hypothetical protein